MVQTFVVIATVASIVGVVGIILAWLTAFKKLQNGEKRKNTYLVMAGCAALLVCSKMILYYIGVA